MTLTEYQTQTEPRFHPFVYLKKSEYKKGVVIGDNTIIHVSGYPDINYLLTIESNCLYTMDKDGNPKRPSVFHILESEL